MKFHLYVKSITLIDKEPPFPTKKVMVTVHVNFDLQGSNCICCIVPLQITKNHKIQLSCQNPKGIKQFLYM